MSKNDLVKLYKSYPKRSFCERTKYSAKDLRFKRNQSHKLIYSKTGVKVYRLVNQVFENIS